MTERSIWSYAQLSTTNIEIVDDIPFDRWEELGDQLHRLIDTGQWGLGGWADFGQRKFGDDYANVIAPSRSRRVNQALWVYRKVRPENRNEQLTWSHHREVAGLDDAGLQKQLLDAAHVGEWDVATLAVAVRKAKTLGAVPEAGEPAEVKTATRLFGAGGHARERETTAAPAPAPQTEPAPTASPQQSFTPRVVAGTEHAGDPLPVEPYSFLWDVVAAAREAIAEDKITDRLKDAVKAVDSLEAIAKRQAV